MEKKKSLKFDTLKRVRETVSLYSSHVSPKLSELIAKRSQFTSSPNRRKREYKLSKQLKQIIVLRKHRKCSIVQR